MKTKNKKVAFHASYVRKGSGDNVTWDYIGLRGCPSCGRHKCLGCGWPYTLSTAEDQERYCSQGCENGVIPPRGRGK